MPEDLDSILGIMPQQDATYVNASQQSSRANQVPSSVSNRASVLMRRYTDAYIVAKVMVGIGNTIKTVGFILAALIFLGAFIFASFASQQRGIGAGDISSGVFLVSLIIGGINAFVVGFIFYVIGVIVSANGQVLKATLDNTVGNSSFLTDDQKAKIMSLPEA